MQYYLFLNAKNNMFRRFKLQNENQGDVFGEMQLKHKTSLEF